MKKIVIGITGASGSLYASRLLGALAASRGRFGECGVVMTENARAVWELELGSDSYKEIPFPLFDKSDFNAPFASGSAGYDAMAIIPCSMGTLGRIASGFSDDLMTRAADVMLKERRRLILVLRDTPYNLIHIRNMETVTLAGGIICPAAPSFYSRPADLPALADTVISRVMDLMGIPYDSFRWGKK